MGIKVQLVDGKEVDHSALINFLTRSGHQVVVSNSVKKALTSIKKEQPDLVFVALNLSDHGGMEVLKKIKKSRENIIIFPIVSSVEQGIGAMKSGAEYYFVKPYDLEEIRIVLDKCLSIKYYKERIEELRLRYLDKLEKSELVVVSKSMKETYQHAVKLVEERNSPILITGEMGTGKEFLAKFICIKSHQFMFPFVFVNCEDRNSKLLDTQLFGVQKGTDSYKGKLEKTHIAEGSTFFLSNIECLSKGDQAKLLKLLKSKKSVKKGEADSSPDDKRIIAATNGNLKILVDKGKFSKELYQKINRRSIHILPLRKRINEIVPLAMHFIKSFNKKYGKKVVKVDPDVKNYLESYDWPGNISELKNFVEHAVILSQSESISMKDVEFNVNKKSMTLESLLLNGGFLSLEEVVSLYVNTVIKKVKGNKSKAAKLLKVSRNTLKKKSIAT